MPKVCIDAGHYGKYNRSPGIPEYYESEAMWKLHLLQKKHLEALGIEVITTRSNQSRDLALKTRGKKAKDCDLFISNHTNAVGSRMDESVDYVAIYHLTEDSTTKADDISRDLAEKLAPIVAETMGIKKYRVRTRKAGEDRNNDGIMNDNYYGVLNGARLVNVPGLLIEHSFHTNTKAVKWLLNEANLNILAKAEAECIAAFLKGNTAKPEAAAKPELPNGAFVVRITADELNVRAGAGIQYKVNKVVKKGEAFTIVKTSGIWGKLKSGSGWISLKYTEKA